MSVRNATAQTRVLLSFSSAYANVARRIANDLRAANIEVRYDQWEGGGGVPAVQSVAADVEDVGVVLPLITPSDAAGCWIGEEWRRTIHAKAIGRGLDVVPLRGERVGSEIPKFLSSLRFPDLHGENYVAEFCRLVEFIRERTGDGKIRLPEGGRAEETAYSPVSFAVTPLAIELGEQLTTQFEGKANARRFDEELVPMMYDGLFWELGVQFPMLQRRVQPDIPPRSVRFMINEVPEAQFEIPADSVMVDESVSVMAQHGFDAEPAINPATGAESAWISARHASAARELGLSTWDARQFVILALSSVLRRKAACFIDTEEAQKMLAQVEPVFPMLVAETVPKTISLFVFTDVLRRLVAEEISVRNLRRILLAFAEWGRAEQDPLVLTEYVRAAFRREITWKFSRGTKQLVVLLLDPEIESTIQDALQYTGTANYLELEPGELRKILDAIREPLDMLPSDAQVPPILTLLGIRSCVRRLVAQSIPRLYVLSYQELTPDTDIQPIGRISLKGFNPRRGVSVGERPLW